MLGLCSLTTNHLPYRYKFATIFLYFLFSVLRPSRLWRITTSLPSSIKNPLIWCWQESSGTFCTFFYGLIAPPWATRKISGHSNHCSAFATIGSGWFSNLIFSPQWRAQNVIFSKQIVLLPVLFSIVFVFFLTLFCKCFWTRIFLLYFFVKLVITGTVLFRLDHNTMIVFVLFLY